MRTNTKTPPVMEKTHGGASVRPLTPEQELRRSVMSCLLWEKEFYESGESITGRIKSLIKKVPVSTSIKIALEAKNDMKLRHIPLFMAIEIHKAGGQGKELGELIYNIIQRPDEFGELLAMLWKENKDAPIPKQFRVGMARAFNKFNEYQFGKYNNQDRDVKLRDALFMVHAKPKDDEQARIFKAIVDNTLAIPDTWETQLSAGKDKKETFERLMKEKSLGGLAFLRNLRKMLEVGVDQKIIKNYFSVAKFDRVLPFRFISAAKHAPALESSIEQGMLRAVDGMKKLTGRTVLIIDTSGSMSGSLSGKSELSREEAANALAILIRSLSDNIAVYATAGNDSSKVHATKLVPDRRGFSLADAITKAPVGCGGIFLKQCMDYVYEQEKGQVTDRIIVITDEQDCDLKLTPNSAKTFGKYNYLINIASTKNGIGYGKWTHVDGFSEASVNYILAAESTDN